MTKKSRICIVHVLAAFLFFMVMSVGMICHAGEEATVSVPNAIIRASADKSSERIGSVAEGGTVDIIGETTGADGRTWYQVYMDANTTGYVRSDLVKKTGRTTGDAAGTSDASAGAVGRTATIKSNNTSIRAGASTSNEKIVSANSGTVVNIVGEENGSDGMKWYQISFTYNDSEKTGYIRSDLVTLNEPAESNITGEENNGEAATEPTQEEPQQSEQQQPESADNASQSKILMNVEETPYIMPGFELIGLNWNDQTINAYKNGNFYIFYAQEQNGEEGWYVFDSEKDVYQRYVYATPDAAIPSEKGGIVGLLPVIILVVIVIILAAVVGLLFLKLREYAGDNEYRGIREEEYPDEAEDIEDIEDIEELDMTPQSVRRPKQVRPSSGAQAQERRPQQPSNAGQSAQGRYPGHEGQPVRRPQQNTAQPVRRPQQFGDEGPGPAGSRQNAGRPQGARPSGGIPQGQNAQSQGRRPGQGGQPVRRPQPQNESAQPQKGYGRTKAAAEKDDDMDFMDL